VFDGAGGGVDELADDAGVVQVDGVQPGQEPGEELTVAVAGVPAPALGEQPGHPA